MVGAKSKRPMKQSLRKKGRQMNPGSREAETVVVDVIEQSAPGVFTITEFEESEVPGQGWVETKGRREP